MEDKNNSFQSRGWLSVDSSTGSYAPLKFVVNAESFRIVIAEERFDPGHLCEETVSAMVSSADETVNCCCPETM